nr:glycoside hydrolase family 6 protein [Hamadaea tsunoensis]
MATSASAAAGCSVTYNNQNSWPGGFTANVTITNLGDAITNGWNLGFDFPAAGQAVQQGWSATWTQSGQHVNAASLDWNKALATNASTSIGFNGLWTSSNPVPTSFTLNGVVCTGGVTTSPSASKSASASPSASASRSASASPSASASRSASASPSPSVSTSPPPPGTHVDNPYVGATGYVNPEWKAHAQAETGGSRVANNSTGVWLDRIAAIAGSSTSMGLKAHLDAAVTQDAANGSTPLTIQFVIYDLPNRDCSALASNGELTVANDGINKYKTLYIDPIAALMSQSAYANLRIVTVIEIDSLPNLVTNTGIAACAEAQSSGAYVQGIQYALNKLHAIPNVYTYIDAAHHGWIGWSSNFGPTADLLASTARGTTAGYASVDGFIVNTANYSALQEPYFSATTSVNGTTVRQSKWVDWNDYVDELSFAQAFRTKLVSEGFSSNIGMLIDTSRNGWGNCVVSPCQSIQTTRPTAASTSTNVDTFVTESRIDRRIHAGNWCNQAGAGLGERPRANPATGIDAYVWIKPPGESDGSSSLISNDQGKGFDRMCDPTYTGNDRNGNSLTGSLPNAPISGAWFSAQFQQLMANAYPPLS